VKVLRLDVETFSSVDLKKCGAAKYFESPDFEIMLCSYKYIIDGIEGPTLCVDLLQGEKLPAQVLADLSDPAVEKTAFNAAFEIGAFEAHFGVTLDPAQWRCTMVHSLYSGLPGDLDGVCKALKTKVQKDFRGSALIRFFCCPVKATKKNNQRTRNFPRHDPERWALFKHYNIVDVECEHEVASRLTHIPIPELEWQHWALDQRMNKRGVRVDLQLVEQAIRADAIIKEKLFAQAVKLTGLQNPNSVAQLKKWLSEELDEEVTKVNKESIPKLISMSSLDDRTVEKVLTLRLQLGKTSISKYHTMKRAACIDGYIRGLTQFYGAGRTGRAAGRLVQLQNLRKNVLAAGFKEGKNWVPFDELNFARELLLRGDIETMELLWGDVLDILSQLVRTALLADVDCVFAPVDFSAIEARWLAWAADEKWRLDVFNTHGKIYEASAAQMFGVPIESITKASPLRQKGKVSELALGYQGGEGALVRMGALEMGLKIEELNPLKDAWRAANLKISGQSYKHQEPGLWELMNNAALRCLELRTPQDVVKGIRFRYATGVLFMRLPSGRELCYCKAKIKDGDYGPEVRFMGQNQLTRQWEEQKSYGGRWTENADQASSRDLLYYKLLRMEQEGLHSAVRFHVHDEAVPSVSIHNAGDSLKRVQAIFDEPVPWAPGLPLRGDGFLTPYFRKDD
jgi:DNA polymerase